MKRRYYMASMIMIVLLALSGCSVYIPTGKYRVTANVSTAYTASGRCHT